jgi:hypothetical protein
MKKEARWTGVTMKKLLAVALLTCFAASGQAQTATTAKPAVSDTFAKSALHFLIATRDSNGSSVAAEHIATLSENLEIEATTPTEKALFNMFTTKEMIDRHYLPYRSTDLGRL